MPDPAHNLTRLSPSYLLRAGHRLLFLQHAELTTATLLVVDASRLSLGADVATLQSELQGEDHHTYTTRIRVLVLGPASSYRDSISCESFSHKGNALLPPYQSLTAYSKALAARPTIVVANKCER